MRSEPPGSSSVKGADYPSRCVLSSQSCSVTHFIPRLGSQWEVGKALCSWNRGRKRLAERAIIGCLGEDMILCLYRLKSMSEEISCGSGGGCGQGLEGPVLSPSQVSLFKMDLIRQLPKVKHNVIIRSSHSTPRCRHQRAEKTGTQTNTCTQMFTALVTITQRSKSPNVHQQINKMWSSRSWHIIQP